MKKTRWKKAKMIIVRAKIKLIAYQYRLKFGRTFGIPIFDRLNIGPITFRDGLEGQNCYSADIIWPIFLILQKFCFWIMSKDKSAYRRWFQASVPFSIRSHNRIIFVMSLYQTILQKSTVVSGSGPCVDMHLFAPEQHWKIAY